MTSSPSSETADLKRRYQWQCRRGASEVEVVLYAYLERFFEDDTPERRAAFGRLLECHDVDMLDWFTGHGEPEDPELREFVAGMLRRVAETD
ncbi:FAD assembly factor SdhE [Alloalcanivorax profundimaris]|uniref:FAD assembly factor SdhE n=1 Tax=Alloalcanivorax profundimaris TaxID=2735259 RepID=UPI000C36EAF4|nr:succinate dehydrogenase assembly factor 2 [Alloalcanivorax profundimaris]MAO61192.1 succinate dehydrogenase assembly factor 2 [Alcanivorax sp.]MBM1143125.1 succinate dehydrogenase assembly factor 2 [Alcanivorax sp. ZXX171]MCQ6261354.1 succinate dehydrogenase assembly factor 2 [Alcanivorax sp. MM125-6]UWN51580.1 Antitoxin CptB [Alcanivorax sp. ALC70]MAY10545.1 succinate dehydrogenase assembly factor 2 [Alcanivorax sp.]|tara:strand:+ start:268 stop:543 length:276 start_codon:yes stop_codon:yes gene_type:complete